MLNPVYIQGIACISVRPTYREGYFLEDLPNGNPNPAKANEPDYRTCIPGAQLRRLNKSMKMAIYTAHQALSDACIDQIQAIITGTGMGCLADTEHFLEAMNEQHELQLNPTPFILSTHNMAAASIALSLHCQGYNMTYTHGASSFESAIMDALLYLGEHPDDRILVGGVDEMGDKIRYFRKRIAAADTYRHTEGAAFFVLAGIPGKNHYGAICAVETLHGTTDPRISIENFLARQSLRPEGVQAVILGDSGDSHLFPDIPQIGYRHIFGHFDTASSIALWLAALMLKKQLVPPALQLNKTPYTHINHLLIYHRQTNGNHSLMLLKR